MAGVSDELLVSVVIPVLHDSAALAKSLARLTAQLPGDAGEVVIASGAELDPDLVALERAHPHVRWVVSPPGRGLQLNAGAARAQGRWLVFLHADTILEDGWVERLQAQDGDSASVAGCFRFVLDSAAWPARVVEWGVGWRVRLFSLPYGDQALFVRRGLFVREGGFAPLPLMEDVEFVLRLRARGHRLEPLALAATTSARRWERDGWIRRSGTNMLLMALYSLNVSPERLASWYHRGERRPDASRGELTPSGAATMPE
jgi:rSAM/selenodomain-associated transferase 2